MKVWHKTLLVSLCFLGLLISFAYHISVNNGEMEDIRAQVFVNIEIDKINMHNVYIKAFLESGEKQYSFSFDDTKSDRVILNTEIYSENSMPPFIRSLYLCVPKENADGIIKTINGISIFIGNKLFYFTGSRIMELQYSEQGDSIIYELNGLSYNKSFFAALFNKSWINWYGDLNFAIKSAFSILFHPEKYFMIWIFTILLIILLKSNLENIYHKLRKKNENLPEYLLLGFIILTGFILRFNGYDRYSLWMDELYSACTASNPGLSFINTFEDPGNPPLYYILLRLFFILFGWSEQSGRLLSVITGTAAIFTSYILVKRFAGKKPALLTAAYIAVSAYFTGFSQEMRNYILAVLLTTITAYRFFIFITKKEKTFNDYIFYFIPSVLLVNTHYYGCLFVFANYLFYIIYTITTKTFNFKKAAVFLAWNMIIALSLLPYFIHTTFNKALFDANFNTWIPKPGLLFTSVALLIPFLGLIYILLRKKLFAKFLSLRENYFLDYSIFNIAFVYLGAYIISLYRPVLVFRYLVILFPLLIAAFAILLIKVLTVKILSRVLGIIRVFLIGLIIFISLSAVYYSRKGGSSDVFKEAQAYITSDSDASGYNKNMLLSLPLDYMQISSDSSQSFYNFNIIPVYDNKTVYDILYINPLRISQEVLDSIIKDYYIDREKILRIRVNNNKYVYKIYNGR